jgi:hypothetical protein
MELDPYQDRVPQDAAPEHAMDGNLLRVLIGEPRFLGRIQTTNQEN